jgi:ABC-type amino acid transport substrate-binding protein
MTPDSTVEHQKQENVMTASNNTKLTATPRARRQRAIALTVAAAAVIALAGCSSTPANSGSTSSPDLGLITPGTIQAATQSDQYPFAFIGTDGKQQGFSIDLVNAIAKGLGVKATYKSLTLDPILSGITADQYDTAAIGLSVNPDRQAAMGFTEPFYYGYFGIMVKKGSGVKGTEASLAGKTLAVVTGSAQVDYSKEHYPSSAVKQFPSQPAALAALLGGQVDAFFLGGPDTVKYLKQNPSLSLAASIPTGTANAFPLPKQNKKLAKAMNGELDTMFADGSYAKIYHKWFTQPIPTQLVQEHPVLKKSAKK